MPAMEAGRIPSKPGVMTQDYGGEDYSMYLDDDDVISSEKQRKSPSDLKRKLLRLLKVKKTRKHGDGMLGLLGPSIHEMSFADTKIGCHERGYQMYRDDKGAYVTYPEVGDVTRTREVSQPCLQRKPSTRASYLNSEVLFRRQKTLPVNYNGLSATLKDLIPDELDTDGSVAGSVAGSSVAESTESEEAHAPAQCPRIARSMSTSNVQNQKSWITTFYSEPNLASNSITDCVLCEAGQSRDTCRHGSRESRHASGDYRSASRSGDSWLSTPTFSSSDVFVEMETCVTSL